MAADSVIPPEGEASSQGGEARDRRSAPWRGRRRTEPGDAKDKFIAVRVTIADRKRIAAKAEEAGLKIGGYLRALALGSAGPRAVKRPRVETEQLAQLLGQIGKLNSNVNQIAKHTNATRDPPGAPELVEMRTDIAAMRAALMQALGHGD